MKKMNCGKFHDSDLIPELSNWNLEAPSKNVRICWVLILILGFVAGALHLYEIVTEYLEYNYHETVMTSTEVYPRFPDVTVCDNSGLAEASMEA